MYQHLFFDLDHTLWDFETNAQNTLAHLYESQQLQKRGINNLELFVEKYVYHNTLLWARYTNGLIHQKDLHWKRMWLTLLDFKITDLALAHQLADNFLALLPTRNALFPDTVETLDYLHKKGYCLHILSNGFKEVQAAKLRNGKIEQYFSQVITSELAQAAKPKKEFFDFALKTTRANIADSLMLGDNLETDIQGALNVGMHCVFVNHVNTTLPTKATYTIKCWNDLRNIL